MSAADRRRCGPGSGDRSGAADRPRDRRRGWRIWAGRWCCTPRIAPSRRPSSPPRRSAPGRPRERSSAPISLTRARREDGSSASPRGNSGRSLCSSTTPRCSSSMRRRISRSMCSTGNSPSICARRCCWRATWRRNCRRTPRGRSSISSISACFGRRHAISPIRWRNPLCGRRRAPWRRAFAPRIRVNAVGPGPVFPNAVHGQKGFETEARGVPLKPCGRCLGGRRRRGLSRRGAQRHRADDRRGRAASISPGRRRTCCRISAFCSNGIVRAIRTRASVRSDMTKRLR